MTEGPTSATQFVKFALLLVLSGVGQSNGGTAPNFCLHSSELGKMHQVQNSNIISQHMGLTSPDQANRLGVCLIWCSEVIRAGSELSRPVIPRHALRPNPGQQWHTLLWIPNQFVLFKRAFTLTALMFSYLISWSSLTCKKFYSPCASSKRVSTSF